MRVAVTYENGQVFQHFGHTRQFQIYEVEDGTVASVGIVDTQGSGHGALAGLLRQAGVEALICGGIGGGAQAALAQAGIALYAGVSGDTGEAVQAMLEGRLVYDTAANCDHHHEGGHDCAGHGHTCGGRCGEGKE